MDKILIGLIIKLVLMALCLNLSQTEVIFRESLDGTVESGNYTYFSYSGDYKISLILRTISGDADLYVSQSDSMGRTVKPRYDLSGHDLQSVTCGEDRIDIPDEFERPIGIGVFGHPSHELSRFTLDVIAFDDREDNDDNKSSNTYVTEDELKFYEEFFGEPYEGFNKVPKNKLNSMNSDKNKNIDNNKNSSNESYSETWDFIINLLGNILHILLEAIL